ncbi:hypothetical protein B0H19DRAFT_1375444 [Mycena capillaripes]|nr:hypothetical protein B0H19DRAFT_1375444 [Mycena capillaripes]
MLKSFVFSIRGPSSEEDFTRFQSKILFYTSTRIAPTVHTCKLVGVSSELPEIYGTTLCDALPQFSNLRQLVLRRVRVTPRLRVAMASTPPNIQLSLAMAMCATDFPASEESGSILLEELAIYNTVYYIPEAFNDARWLHVLNHRILRALVLGTAHSTAICMRVFINGLQLPALEVLVVWPDWSSDLPSTVIPMLSSFNAPDHLAQVFCATRKITRLSLHGAVGFHACDLQTLEEHLFAISRKKGVPASLELRIEYPTKHLLEIVASAFPMLRSLRLVAPGGMSWDNHRPDIQTILSTIDSFVLPRHLEVLYLAFTHVHPQDGLHIAHEIQDADTATTIQNLVQRNPHATLPLPPTCSKPAGPQPANRHVTASAPKAPTPPSP